MTHKNKHKRGDKENRKADGRRREETKSVKCLSACLHPDRQTFRHPDRQTDTRTEYCSGASKKNNRNTKQTRRPHFPIDPQTIAIDKQVIGCYVLPLSPHTSHLTLTHWTKRTKSGYDPTKTTRQPLCELPALLCLVLLFQTNKSLGRKTIQKVPRGSFSNKQASTHGFLATLIIHIPIFIRTACISHRDTGCLPAIKTICSYWAKAPTNKLLLQQDIYALVCLYSSPLSNKGPLSSWEKKKKKKVENG